MAFSTSYSHGQGLALKGIMEQASEEDTRFQLVWWSRFKWLWCIRRVMRTQRSGGYDRANKGQGADARGGWDVRGRNARVRMRGGRRRGRRRGAEGGERRHLGSKGEKTWLCDREIDTER